MKRNSPLSATGRLAALLQLIACMAILISAPANAETIRYQVHGVAADDVLNVRATPAPAAEKIGTLAPGETGIAGTGNRASYQSEDWVEIRTEAVTGWVNGRYLTRIMPHESALADDNIFHEPLSCHGTEPFWGLTVEGRTGQLDSLADGKWQITFNNQRRTSSMIPAWAIEGQTPDGAPATVIVEQAEACSDGMSDISYLYSVYVHLRGGPFLNGCCNAPPGSLAP